MTRLPDALALGVSLTGLLAIAVASPRGRWREGLHMALLLWAAAGLLRLSGGATWSRIAASAMIIAVRQLVLLGLRYGPLAMARLPTALRAALAELPATR